MSNNITAEQQKTLLNWLKQQGVRTGYPLFLLPLYAAIIFILQLIIFWYLSLSLHSIIIATQTPATDTIAVLLTAMLLLLAMERLKIHHTERLEQKIYASLQEQLFSVLKQKQFALVRQHSTYFWQQLWLTHLPAVSQFNARYLTQQRFIMSVPLIVLPWVFAINWLVGLSLLISLPIVPLFMVLVGQGAANLHRKHFKALARLGSVFVNRIKSLELLHIFNAHQSQVEVLSIASDGLNKRTMGIVGVAFLSSSVLDFFSTLAVALVAVFVGFNLLGEITLAGQLNLHTGLFLLLSAPLCFSELKQLGRLYHLRAQAIAAAEELRPILTSHTDNQNTSQRIDANHFSQISWHAFSVTTPSIKAPQLNFNKGDWIFLQGASGSGKTCFLESLMGQRESTHCIDNAVLISQHPVILPISIRDNLSLGNQYSAAQLTHAIKQVELDSWLAQQPNGLETLMHEQIPMSGGQKQRLSLARALLSQANLILLDEPTAHLTDEQHARLSQIIQTTLQHKTVIWASHKTLPNAWFKHQWQIENGVLSD